MSTRELKRRALEGNLAPEIKTGTCSDEAETLRKKAGDLLSAADEAIERASSTDAEAFLKAIRQPDGQ